MFEFMKKHVQTLLLAVILPLLCVSSCGKKITQKEIVGEYYWDAGMGYEVKVFINQDGTWKKDVFENGKKTEGSSSSYNSGKYKVITKVIKKADKSYEVNIVSFDDGKTGYLFNDGCFEGLNDDIWLQTEIQTGDDPFPGINEDGGREYCKK
jgi:hypothetical protein